MNNNSTQSTTIGHLHTHHVQQLDLQAVGGAIRLGHKKNVGQNAMTRTFDIRQIGEPLSAL